MCVRSTTMEANAMDELCAGLSQEDIENLSNFKAEINMQRAKHSQNGIVTEDAIKFLRAARFSAPRAIEIYKNYQKHRENYNLDNLRPHREPLASEIGSKKLEIVGTHDPDGAPLVVFTASRHDTKNSDHKGAMQLLFFTLDQVAESPESQENGVVFIFDMRDSLMSSDPRFLHNMLSVIQEGYPLYQKMVYVVSANFMTKTQVTIVKTLKHQNRVKFVSLSELPHHIAVNQLPLSLGGTYSPVRPALKGFGRSYPEGGAQAFPRPPSLKQKLKLQESIQERVPCANGISDSSENTHPGAVNDLVGKFEHKTKVPIPVPPAAHLKPQKSSPQPKPPRPAPPTRKPGKHETTERSDSPKTAAKIPLKPPSVQKPRSSSFGTAAATSSVQTKAPTPHTSSAQVKTNAPTSHTSFPAETTTHVTPSKGSPAVRGGPSAGIAARIQSFQQASENTRPTVEESEKPRVVKRLSQEKFNLGVGESRGEESSPVKGKPSTSQDKGSQSSKLKKAWRPLKAWRGKGGEDHGNEATQKEASTKKHPEKPVAKIDHPSTEAQAYENLEFDAYENVEFTPPTPTEAEKPRSTPPSRRAAALVKQGGNKKPDSSKVASSKVPAPLSYENVLIHYKASSPTGATSKGDLKPPKGAPMKRNYENVEILTPVGAISLMEDSDEEALLSEEEGASGAPEEVIYENFGPDEGNRTMTLEELERHITTKGKKGLSVEYLKIRNEPLMGSYRTCKLPCHKGKNRYKDVVCYDDSRVLLKPMPGIEGSDYIHANYVSGYNKPEAFILTQGPLKKTVVDFWQLVWEKQVFVIVMTTKCVELGKNKCAQYWPDDGSIVYGNVTVQVVWTQNCEGYDLRAFKVQSEGVERTIMHFQFLAWPDYGVPSSGTAVLDLIKAVRETQAKYSKFVKDTKHLPPFGPPVVVHCSAGVGRSGTFCTIDYCIDELHDQKRVNVQRAVRKLRQQRAYAIQTDEQYEFCYRTVLEYSKSHKPTKKFH